MKFIYFSILLVIGTANATSVTTTVEMQINGADRETLLRHAKSKAVLQAIGDLPTVIWGEQHLVNNDFSESIKAIGFAQAEVKVLVEKYDLTQNNFHIQTEVSWNDSKILSMLKAVQEGEDAKRRVAGITKLLNSIELEKHLTTEAYSRLVEAKLLSAPFVKGATLATAHQLYTRTLTQMIELRKGLVLNYINSIVIEPIGFENNEMVFSVALPPVDTIELSFESLDLQNFYHQNNAVINSESWCYATEGVLDIAPTCKLSEKSQLSENCPSVEPSQPIHTKLRLKPSDSVLKGVIRPVYFLPCEKKTKGAGDFSKITQS